MSAFQGTIFQWPRRALAVFGLALCLALPALALAGAAQADPTLWKVTRGGATAYLFGSIHLLKPDAVWDKPKVEAALNQSQELWLEIKDVDDSAAMTPLVRQYGMDASHPLSAKLDDAYRAKLASALKSLNAPPTALDLLRPWLASVTLSILPLQKAGYDPKAGVDVLIKAAAEKRGLQIMAFETTEAQVRYFADMPPGEELDMLKQSLDEFSDTLETLNKAEAAWERGDQRTLATLMRADMTDSLYQRLLVGRNRNFVRQIEARMQRPGVIFVVVGAGHLAGPDGVPALLAQMGFRVATQ